MSRSFRHRGWLTDQSGRKFGKRHANHVVRRAADVPSGRCYRKFYCSYNICDYVISARPRGSCPDAYKDWETGWKIEFGVLDFILFLLVGMKVPLTDSDADDILSACVYNGYEEVLKVLLEHHTLGALFRSRGCLMKSDIYPWTCWKREKRRRMAKLLALGGNQRSCTDE